MNWIWAQWYTECLEELIIELAQAGEVLPTAERAAGLGSMAGLAYNYLEPGMAEALLEALPMTNAFEQLLEETISHGLIQGLEQGLEQGLLAAKREDLLKVLSRRFGPLDPAVTARIEAIGNPDRLSTLFDAALDAGTLAEFERVPEGGSDA